MMGDGGNPWVYRQFVQRSCSGIGNRLSFVCMYIFITA